MKLTIFGLTLSSAWGNGHATPYRALLRALKRLGHDVTFYEKDVPYYARRRDFSRCDYCKLVLYSDWQAIRPWALAEAAGSDVVMTSSYLPQGAQINDEVLELVQPLRVFYDLDAPITLAGLEAGDGELEYLRASQIPEFDAYLSFTGGRILEELEQRWGARRAQALYGSVDPEAHQRTEAREELRCDLSYMGTYAADRQQKLETLLLGPARQMPEWKFVLAGSLYPEMAASANLQRLEHVAPAEHPALYSSSRATLNLTRAGMAAHGGFCPSGRLFEAAACGTPILSDWFEGLDSFFAPGEEIFVVENAADVVAALRCPEKELARLARRAQQRTLQEHTGMNRARELLEILQGTRWASRERGAVRSGAEKPLPLITGT